MKDSSRMLHRITIKLAIILLFVGYSQNSVLNAQDNSVYIYGTVKALDGEKYTGYIRWGKEEMYWHDIFNSTKVKNFKTEQSQKNRKSGWKNLDWSFSSIWKDDYQTNTHTFACFFGDISSMIIKRGDRVLLEFKNGAQLEVKGGSNDVGANLVLYDYELGKINFDWDDLSLVQFQQAPADAEPPYGKPLYGTVYTSKNSEFTGLIKWDLDERNGQDILDGKSKYGTQKIPFEKIKSLVKILGGNGVNIGFDSGRTMELSGSNDCDNSNHGIGVYVDGIGSLEIDWDDFKRLELTNNIPFDCAFDEFLAPKGIKAEITTYAGITHTGYIAFDRDELYDFEFIDGDDDDIEFQVPVRNIRSITPKNRSYSEVVLKNGDSYLLGARQDVTDRNDGVLIFDKEEDTTTEIPWHDIVKISFK